MTSLTNRCQTKYEPYSLKLGPTAIAVGPTVDSIERSYVRVNETLWEVDNPMKAVDICFKVLHALDAVYPKESEREYFFLERAVYSINVDKKMSVMVGNKSVDISSRVKPAIEDFNSFKKH